VERYLLTILSHGGIWSELASYCPKQEILKPDMMELLLANISDK
jgi:hypothetical protein